MVSRRQLEFSCELLCSPLCASQTSGGNSASFPNLRSASSSATLQLAAFVYSREPGAPFVSWGWQVKLELAIKPPSHLDDISSFLGEIQKLSQRYVKICESNRLHIRNNFCIHYLTGLLQQHPFLLQYVGISQHQAGAHTA